MHKNYYLSPLAVSLSMAMSAGYAADPVALQTTLFTDLQSVFQLALPSAKTLASTPVRTPQVDTLQFVTQHTDTKNITHVRMQQYYAGFPVFGGYAIMHSNKSVERLLAVKHAATNDVKMNGMIYRGLKTELGQPSPAFIVHAKVALQQFKNRYLTDAVSEEQVTPMIYIDDQHQAFWAYKVSILVSHTDNMPERPTAIIDAQTLKPFLQWNDLKTVHSAVNGIGFGGNHRIGQYQFGSDLPLLSISRDNQSAICYMENKDVKVVDMEHKYSGSRNSMTFSCNQSTDLTEGTYWTGYNGDGYDQQNGAYSPSNDALYTGQVIKDLYREWYGLDVLKKQDLPMKLVMRVHYGTGFENAYWDSKQMTFGDGASMMYPLVSLGIGAHEISHGFTEQHSDLQYFGQSGGINEAFSDMAAQAAEYYSQGKNSWAIGAEVMKESSGYKALRFMDRPSRDGRSIDRADQYHEGIDVHHSSGVYNHLFYLLANDPLWDVKQAFHVMVKANMDYWTPYTSFEEGACGIINAAHDLGLSTENVKQALDQVAIDYVNCSE